MVWHWLPGIFVEWFSHFGYKNLMHTTVKNCPENSTFSCPNVSYFIACTSANLEHYTTWLSYRSTIRTTGGILIFSCIFHVAPMPAPRVFVDVHVLVIDIINFFLHSTSSFFGSWSLKINAWIVYNRPGTGNVSVRLGVCETKLEKLRTVAKNQLRSRSLALLFKFSFCS